MSRFRFRLQPVLDVRTRIQDERQRELALKVREHGDAEAALRALHDNRAAQRRDLAVNHRALGVEELRATYAHLAYLDRAIEDQSVRVAACADEVARAQVQLVAANTDRKVIETLRTRRYEAFTADAAIVEQREVDDQNARRYGRGQAVRENDHE